MGGMYCVPLNGAFRDAAKTDNTAICPQNQPHSLYKCGEGEEERALKIKSI